MFGTLESEVTWRYLSPSFEYSSTEEIFLSSNFLTISFSSLVSSFFSSLWRSRASYLGVISLPFIILLIQANCVGDKINPPERFSAPFWCIPMTSPLELKIPPPLIPAFPPWYWTP